MSMLCKTKYSIYKRNHIAGKTARGCLMHRVWKLHNKEKLLPGLKIENVLGRLAARRPLDGRKSVAEQAVWCARVFQAHCIMGFH